MLDPITLDQIRTFVTVVDEGSFSAAARKLRRVQSAVSHAMANLETQLGVVLWDRAGRLPRLTDQGRVLVDAARRMCADADAFRRIAHGLVSGLEPSISLCVDAVYPVTGLADLCREFAREFPTVELRIDTESMLAVAARVVDGSAHLGVVGPTGLANGLARHHLGIIRMVPVVAAAHPLAALRGRIPTEQLAEHMQIVLSERMGGGVPDQGVLSPRTWRVADLGTKHALLRAGVGWGNLPEHMVREDLRARRLVRIQPDAWGKDEHLLSLSVVHRPGLVAGPAMQWLLRRLQELCKRDLGEPALRQKRDREPRVHEPRARAAPARKAWSRKPSARKPQTRKTRTNRAAH